MESTGIRGKIQVSEATASILRAHGRDHWVIPRADAVKVRHGCNCFLFDFGASLTALVCCLQAKGKGVLKTYWANPKNRQRSSMASVSSDMIDEEEGSDSTDDATAVLQQAQVRLVDWIVKLMSDDIKKIVSFHQK